MTRQEILDQITAAMGSVPGFFEGLGDAQLEHLWGLNVWFSSNTRLAARDKALVAFGVASGLRCRY